VDFQEEALAAGCFFQGDHPLGWAQKGLWGPESSAQWLRFCHLFVCLRSAKCQARGPCLWKRWAFSLRRHFIVSFIFAGHLLIIRPVIYRPPTTAERRAWILSRDVLHHHGWRPGGNVIEFVFSPLGLIPSGNRHARTGED